MISQAVGTENDGRHGSGGVVTNGETFRTDVYAFDLPWPAGRFTVVVLLPPYPADENTGYAAVLSHREPGHSTVVRFDLGHPLPGGEYYKKTDQELPEAAMAWIGQWAAEWIEDVANERRVVRELEPTDVDREDLLDGAVEDEDVGEELRTFCWRPGAAGFLGDVDSEAPDVATWLRTHAPEHAFEITPVVPPTPSED